MKHMDGLTISQAREYTGYSHNTWIAWLNSGKVKGNKGNGDTDSWFIPHEEVERIRQETISKLQIKIDNISTPVPSE